MRLVLALISVLSVVGTTQAFETVSVPVQYKGHDIQLPGRFDKPTDPDPFPAVVLLHGCTDYEEHPPHSTLVEHASWRGVRFLDRRQLHATRRVLVRWCAVQRSGFGCACNR